MGEAWEIWEIYIYVGECEVPTAVVMKSFIFWDITPCSPLKMNQRFGEICRLHLQGRRMSQARNQPGLLAICVILVSWFAYSYALKMDVCSSEAPVDLQQTTGCHIPVDIILQILVLGGRSEGNRPLGRRKCRWKGNIKMGHKEKF
jgi:hypothetical protein